MKSQIKAVATKTAIWLVVEIILTITGLDNMADYSEFLFGREFALSNQIVPSIVLSSLPM